MKIWSYRYAEDIQKSYANRHPIITYESDLYFECSLAYNWMMEQMEKKFKRPSFVNFPFWAWYAYEGKNKKPDMRKLKRRNSNKIMTLIECDINEERLVLSDEGRWNSVLFNRFISDSEDEYVWFKNKEKSLSNEVIQELKIQSWGRIFDLTGGDPNWCGEPKERYIQATTWFIEYNEIVSARLF